jgi:Winged helix domain, variant/ATPase family associated with various cellular activities (AAA)
MGPDPPSALLDALERLDARLEAAVAAASSAWDRSPGDDPYRGLYATPDDARSLLARGPLGPPFMLAAAEPLARVDEPPFDGLARTFGLDAVELDTLVFSLAPELDVRYGRLYGFLSDDMTRRWPTVDLALTLLCASREERLAGRLRFGPHAPLAAGRILAVADERLVLDPQVAGILVGLPSLHPVTAPFTTVSWPDRPFAAVPTDAGAVDTLERLAGVAPVRLALHGHAAAHHAAAEALAAARRCALVSADLRDVVRAPEPVEAMRLLFRERRLRAGVLFLAGADAVDPNANRRELAVLADGLATAGGVVVLSTADRWHLPAVPGPAPMALVTLELGDPGDAVRRSQWQRALSAYGVDPNCELGVLAARYMLDEHEIEEIAAAAAAAPAGSAGADLQAAARRRSGHALGRLAARIEPCARWDDLVVPEDTRDQLRELCTWAAQRRRVLDQWGLGRTTSRGRGIAALFSGAAGTGKTLAAEVVAGELGLDLYRIDLAGVVSKYVGETEKNLDRVFDAAERANAVLLFDEADALFGKRSAVRDSHDRYANIEISYLLQRMEAYDGLAVLSTNLRDNLDAAFLRRLAFVVTFPFPEVEERRRIWDVVWPVELPRARDVDLEELAETHRLSGGQIRNVVLAAAYLAAADGGCVHAGHVEHALGREYGKTGRDASARPTTVTEAAA